MDILNKTMTKRGLVKHGLMKHGTLMFITKHVRVIYAERKGVYIPLISRVFGPYCKLRTRAP